ncbi:54S ribosomal protein L17, mitochondrial [Wickerhamomyces ciferrii]|uniref:Large ribosomal subunit protein mL46 n=1 Tax=Wickerhamomyces ciferrii (strain ATCC 14091 / BCRC 22168 / CBS 111 / JCM 3599 / NBRC 0793 / NRRL Y-1031 F-60-10) TaxID=1206466 RepID=K0KGR1_WICCF|nr:54S ribosomal protein L17, mitochondrial [Wickerhamomyces ciferrii]CCH42166.1 54S ribosomal protein L17, mitochondrial [Wickerhamomyces ciferrii]
MVQSRSITPKVKETIPLESLRSTLLLARNPIVTPDLTPFEKVYYNYQEELERRLMWTFPQYYYFRKGTLSERRFVAAQKGPVTKQPGVFYEKGKPDVVHNRERRLKQEIVIPRQETEEGSSLDEINRPVIPNSRITKADEINDITSLERKLPRTLYLLIKDSKLGWRLPSFSIENTSKGLNEVAEEGLRKLGGEAINTWNVSNTVTAVLKFQNDKLVKSDDSSSDLTREYIIKSHILSGSFKPEDSNLEFAWLSKEELKDYVSEDYFNATEFLLSDI